MRTENERGEATRCRKILGAIVASALPVLVGLFFLGSIRVQRPALGRRSWQWLLPPGAALRVDPGCLRRLTTIWAVAFIGIGLLQFVGAAVVGFSAFDPLGLALRSALALVCGVFVYAVVAVRYGHTRSADPR